MQDTIKLSGGKKIQTDDKNCSYKVLEGSVLVYLVPILKNEDGTGRQGRRLFVYEAKKDEDIPAFCHDSKIFGSFRFELMALSEAGLLCTHEAPDDKMILSFADKIELLPSGKVERFEADLIERYNKKEIKEKGYVYANVRGEKQIIDQSLRATLHMFEGDGSFDEPYVATGQKLYDAVAFICKKKKISIAPLSKIKDICGTRFTLEDIARISHFCVREVTLKEKWFTQDNGILLAFRDKDNHPVPCYVKRVGRYFAYDTKTDKSFPVKQPVAGHFAEKAFVFYKPFPAKPIGKKDLLSFGLSEVYKSDIVRLFFLAFLGTLVGLVIPTLSEKVYDSFIPMGNTEGLLSIGIIILALMLGNVAFTAIKNLAGFRSMNSMKYAVLSATVDRLFNLPSTFLRQFETADLSQRVMGVSLLYEVLAQNAITVILSALFSVMYFGKMFRYSKELAKTGLLLLVPAVVFMLWLGVKQVKKEREKLSADLVSEAAMYEYISGIEKIQLAAAENRVLSRYMSLFLRSRRIDMEKEKTTVLVDALTDCLPLVFSAVLYYQTIKKGAALSLGAFSGFIAAFSALSAAVMGVVRNFLLINMVGVLYENASPILQELPESDDAAAVPVTLTGELEVDHVVFSYEQGEEPVLKDISFHLKSGEYAAIVGASGCGKSTLLKLLLGFEKPTLGKIYYGRQDLDGLDKRELRKKLGVVLQNDGLISGSIFENIAITAPGINKEDVDRVIDEVGLTDDINAMPMGLHTVVSEGAGTISGGQMQRILIARAIVGKPKIIFLDEATSALDNVTQRQVIETLDKLKATKLVIAHRLSTVRHCDRIFVMDEGRIVEEGDYDTLMEKKGLFYELARRQI